MEKQKLPKPASSATDEQLSAYITSNGLLVGGDKRVLTEEVQRLRQVCRDHGVDEEKIILAKPTPTRRAEPRSNEDELL